MFDALIERKKELIGKIKYQKELGWKEFDEDGDSSPVAITVLDVDWGYSVFRNTSTIQHLHWTHNLSDAVEWAVDRARNEIAEHEIKQVEKLPKGK